MLIRLKDIPKEQLDALKEHYNQKTYTAVLRYLIVDKYREIKKEKINE